MITYRIRAEGNHDDVSRVAWTYVSQVRGFCVVVRTKKPQTAKTPGSATSRTQALGQDRGLGEEGKWL
jgi:hypothetical protein